MNLEVTHVRGILRIKNTDLFSVHLKIYGISTAVDLNYIPTE